MYLKELNLQNFRELNISQIELSPGINFFSGDNGAGKTSFLEAVYFLSCCKSFRTSDLDNLVAYNQEWLSVNAVAAKSDNSIDHTIAVNRVKNKSRATIDGSVVKKASQLSLLLPSLVMCSEKQRLFIAPPQTRRNFIDWCVFHVKPESINYFSKYDRALRQRNAAIKSKSSESLIKAWDVDLIESGSMILELRTNLLDKIQHSVRDLSVDGFGSLEFMFNNDIGCGRYDCLVEAIEKGFDQDLRYGFTRYGPHRFDFSVSASGRDVKDNFSRGQTKLLVFYLILAQSAQIKEFSGNNPWLLFDDFTSDFSIDLLGIALDKLSLFGNQTFITSAANAAQKQVEKNSCRLFHVEHGNVKKMI